MTKEIKDKPIKSDDGYITKAELKKGLEDFDQKLDFKMDLKLKTLKSEIVTTFAEKTAQIERSFTEKTAQIEKSFTEKTTQIEKSFTEKTAQIERSFTEKTAQVEEKFFKYTFIAVGSVLGGVSILLALYGLLEYKFLNSINNHQPQPIVIYTTPQQMQVPSPQAPNQASGQSVQQSSSEDDQNPNP